MRLDLKRAYFYIFGLVAYPVMHQQDHDLIVFHFFYW